MTTMAECYQVDVAELLPALTSYPVVSAYLQESEQELAGIVEPSLMHHLKRMQGLAQQVLSGSWEALAAADRPGCDCLLSELFALATWHSWPLPVQGLPPQALPEELPTSGFLSTGDSGDGAQLWCCGDSVFLSRQRDVGGEADLRPHWSSH